MAAPGGVSPVCSSRPTAHAAFPRTPSRPHFLDRLPNPRGRLGADGPLGPQTGFRAGGPAEVLYRPADTGDLSAFLKALPADVPVTVLGVGSNLLVRDGGVKGVVVR